jgi:hypothetical protein
MKIIYKWELRHGKDESVVLSNDIRELQRLQGELCGFIYRRVSL